MIAYAVARGKHHRPNAPNQITPKTQMRNLADHHVLRIADQRGRRTNVAGNAQRAIKNGTGLICFRKRAIPVIGAKT